MKVLALLGLCAANDQDPHTDGVLDLEDQDFKSMSYDDQEKLLEKIFAKMDQNGNGTLDKKEMLDWSWVIEKKYMTEDVEGWMRFYDLDRNNIVEEDEFVSQLDKRTFKHTGSVDLEKRRFRASDKDNNGALDKDEFYPFLYPRYYQDMKSGSTNNTLYFFI